MDAFTNKIIAKVNCENLLNDKSEINVGLKAWPQRLMGRNSEIPRSDNLPSPHYCEW